MQIDLRVAELLASRLCHDLVGPIGAINNGMELLADDEFGMAEDALQLASSSARRAADSLQFFRLAYGLAGSRVGGGLNDLRNLMVAHLKPSKTELDWEDTSTPDGAPEDLGKLLLNMVELGLEALPRGGRLTVELRRGPDALDSLVTATGQDVQFRPESLAGLADEVDLEELSPRGVQGYFTRLVAKRLGSDLAIEPQSADSLQLRVTLPA